MFSGAGTLLRLLREDEAVGRDVPALTVTVLPGISSLSTMCAKTGISYEDMKIVSLHGRQESIAVHVRTHAKTFFVLGGKTDAAAVCRILCEYGLSDVTVYVGENLGSEGEQITHGAASELCELKTDYLSVAVAVNPAPVEYLPCGIADDAFERVLQTDGRAHRTIPMTKANVRSAAVAALKIRRRDTCWDVGCGTGSVSVEMAFRCPDGRVYGFDREEEAAALTMRNARRFSCDNITAQVMAFPPEDPVRGELPVPDRVFIGGAGGRIREIVCLAKDLNPACRIVITAVSLETLEEGRTALDVACGGCEVVQLGVTCAQKTGRVTMMKAFNPVFILTGE